MDQDALVDSFKDVSILVVGDPMIDVYHFGRVDRISPEAPVPVFVEEREESRRGGADNVAFQLQALCTRVLCFFPPKPWIEKHRYLVGSHQLFRSDRDYRYNHNSPCLESSVCSAIVVSDYAKGSITSIPKATCPIVVDPKGSDWLKYEGCAVICPNEKEYNQWDGRGSFSNILVKRGEHGMRLIQGKTQTEIPAQARHVFDPTGCGDTVVAVLAASLGAGADLQTAARMANIAAGYVVGEVGTAVCSAEKLKQLCRS